MFVLRALFLRSRPRHEIAHAATALHPAATAGQACGVGDVSLAETAGPAFGDERISARNAAAIAVHLCAVG